MGFAELLTGKEELDKETKREYGQMIQTNAESLLNYVNSILELSRLESGKIQYEDEECDIIRLCSEVLDKVNGREESTVSVSLQTDLKEQFARTDRRWFDTLLVSMLTPSENDTARYEAIIRIRRDRSKPLLYFDVVNAPFAKVHFENKTSLFSRNQCPFYSLFWRYLQGANRSGGRPYYFVHYSLSRLMRTMPP